MDENNVDNNTPRDDSIISPSSAADKGANAETSSDNTGVETPSAFNDKAKPDTFTSPSANESSGSYPGNTVSQPPQPLQSSMGLSPRSGAGSKKSKLVFGVVLAAFLLIGGSAAAYVGFVLPNQPDNIWSTALRNTSKGFDKLVAYEESQKDKKTFKLDGDYQLTSTDTKIDGKYSAQMDEKNSKVSFDAGLIGSRINFELITKMSEASPYPDVYARVEGVGSFNQFFADSGMEGLLTEIDNKWYSADHSLFDQLTAGLTEEDVPSINEEDINALIKVVGKVNNDYLFTTDPSKAVLNNKEYVGKESDDGRSVHHFKVGLHKENLKQYVRTLKAEIAQTEVYKQYSSGDEDALNIDELLKGIDSINESDTADVWVDASTKLIRKIGINDKENDKNTLEAGLAYNGGDDFPFFFNLHAEEDESMQVDVNFTATLNTKQHDLKIALDVDTSDNSFDMKLNGVVTRSSDPLEVEVPTEATPITELIGSLFGGFSLPEGGGLDAPPVISN